mgnify:FL=1
MDLAKLDMTEHANNSATLEVLHPITGEFLTDNAGNVVTIDLLGSDSTKMRNAMSARARKQLAQKKPNQITTIDDAERASAELLAEVVTGWHGVEENSTVLECTKDNVVYILTKYSWLRLQVDQFVSDRSNFFKA